MKRLFEKIDQDTVDRLQKELDDAAEAKRVAEERVASIVTVIKQRLMDEAERLEVDLTFLPFQDGYTLYADLGGMLIVVQPMNLKSLEKIDLEHASRAKAEFQASVLGFIVGEPPRLSQKPIGSVSMINFDQIAKTIRELPAGFDVRSTELIKILLRTSREKAAKTVQALDIATIEELEEQFK